MKKLWPVSTGIVYVAIVIALLVGEVKCIIKFVKCDFEPNYKAEIVYGVAMVTGLGCVVGYLDLGK